VSRLLVLELLSTAEKRPERDFAKGAGENSGKDWDYEGKEQHQALSLISWGLQWKDIRSPKPKEPSCTWNSGGKIRQHSNTRNDLC